MIAVELLKKNTLSFAGGRGGGITSRRCERRGHEDASDHIRRGVLAKPRPHASRRGFGGEI